MNTVSEAEWIEREQKALEERRQSFQQQVRAGKTACVAAIGIPGKDLALFRNGGVEETEAVRALAKPEGITVLSGGPGTGKTTAAAWWLYREAIDDAYWKPRDERYFEFTPKHQGHSSMWLTAPAFSRWPHYDEEKVRKLLRIGHLVIDDLGAEYLDEKGFYLSLFDEVINERYQAAGTVTVMTTNLDAAGFKKRYGERIADRIREVGRFLSVGNVSMRGKKTA